jgi:tetratricopeptide (TPR) repeat protein
VSTTQDFNYKVALASGLRELQAGRLTKAEQQFQFLCEKFVTSPGGYRGLAKVRLEQADRPGALTVLRDGAAKLAKAGEHPGVVALLTEALSLDPLDLAAHRRLAAAHALAGEMDAATAEYARYARAISATDPAGAQRETRYGLDSLGPQPGLVSLASEVGLDVDAAPAPRRTPAETAPLPPGAIPGLPRRERTDAVTSVDPRAALLDSLGTVVPAADEPPPVRSVPHPVQTAPQRERVPEPPLDENEDPLAADERAAQYIAAKDPRAAQAALVAARHFIADGRTNAASDLLLQLIASGLADHQAQRLLVDVVSSIGKRDVARAKCALLAEALRLDGQNELAVEVERLAQAV